MNDLTFNSISEIKEAYQIKWNLRRQESQQQLIEVTPTETKVDYDDVAQQAFDSAIELGATKKQALVIYRNIKRNR